MPNRILVCLDGSERSEAALPYAMTCARNAGPDAELLLAQVPEPLYYAPHFMPVAFHELAESLRIQVTGYLEHLASELRAVGFRARACVPVGAVHEALIHLAEEEDVDLVVVTSHGRSGLRRWMLGSVAERVLRHSPAPVLLLPLTCLSRQRWQSVPPPRLSRVLVPLDGSALSETILQFPDVVPLRPEQFHMVVATDVPEFLGRDLLEQDGLGEYIRELEEYLRCLSVSPELRSYEVTWRVADALAPEGVLEEAEEVQPDFIAMMTQGRSGLGRFWVGSVAEKIARAATCPVLLLNPRCVAAEEAERAVAATAAQA